MHLRVHKLLVLLLCVGTAISEDSRMIVESSTQNEDSRTTGQEMFRRNQSSRQERERSVIECDGTMITLRDTSVYVVISNSTLFYTPLLSNLTITSFTQEGSPVVCIPAEKSIHFFNHGFSLLSSSVLEFYHTLTIFSLVSSVAGLLLGIISFAQYRSVFGFIALNLAIAFASSDLVVVLHVFLHKNINICTVLSIAEHFFLLAQYAWLVILGVDFALRFYRVANSLNHKKHSVIMFKYFPIGWGVPCLAIVLAIIVNFAPGTRPVLYAANGFCHISALPATVGAVIVPLLTSWTVWLIAVLWIFVYLYKLPFSFDSCDKRQFALMVAFLCTMAILLIFLMWILLDTSPYSHTGALFVCTLATMVRSGVFIVGFIPKSRLFKKIKSVALNYKKNRVSIAPSITSSSSSVIDHNLIECHPVAFESNLARQYPVETEELVRLVSNPEEVPKIHKCAQNYAPSSDPGIHIPIDCQPVAFESNLARQYSVETEELVRLVSNPEEVPKIHKCAQNYALSSDPGIHIPMDCQPVAIVSRFARQYPMEAEELERIVSNPKIVPKIHKCTRNHTTPSSSSFTESTFSSFQ